MGFSFEDIFLGTGYFENTVLFYGSPEYTVNSTLAIKGYDISKGYFWVTGIGYVIYIGAILVGFMSAYKRSFIDSANLERKQFGVTIFSSWQMSVQDQKTSQLLKTRIYEDLNKMLTFQSRKN